MMKEQHGQYKYKKKNAKLNIFTKQVVQNYG